MRKLMSKQLLLSFILILFVSSCSNGEETFLGEFTNKEEGAKEITMDDFLKRCDEKGLNTAKIDTAGITRIIDLTNCKDIVSELKALGVNTENIFSNKKGTKALTYPPTGWNPPPRWQPKGPPVYVEKETKGNMEWTNSKAEMGTIAVDYNGVGTGNFVFEKATVKGFLRLPPPEYSEFFILESPDCGFLNAAASGYVNNKIRSYSSQAYDLNVCDWEFSLTTYAVYVVSSGSGKSVKKWIPCHPNDMVFKYGTIYQFGFYF